MIFYYVRLHPQKGGKAADQDDGQTEGRTTKITQFIENISFRVEIDARTLNPHAEEMVVLVLMRC